MVIDCIYKVFVRQNNMQENVEEIQSTLNVLSVSVVSVPEKY